MNKYEAIKLIKESGLVIEKMSDEEKAAKRKERREARKAEEKAYRDAHWTFNLNVRGGGAYSMVYELVKMTKELFPECEFINDEDEDWAGLRFVKNDSSDKRHFVNVCLNGDQLKKMELYTDVYLDGEDIGDKRSYRDSESNQSWMSMRESALNYEWKEYSNGRTSEFDFIVTVNKKDFKEFWQSVVKRAVSALDRKINMINAESGDSEDRKIPEFEYMEFEFTDDPIDAMDGKRHRYKVPEDFVMKFFHENCGNDNNSYKDFKEFFDSLGISFMRSMSDEGSLMRGGFTFSQYKWFRRGGGELKGHLWSFPAFLGYDNDDVELKGWKLM